MHMQLHLASDYARPITAVKLDCRRLSPADRPNKTRIFSGITAVPTVCPLAPSPTPCAHRVISILYFMGNRRAMPVDIPMPALFADNVVVGGYLSLFFFLVFCCCFFCRGKYVYANRKELTLLPLLTNSKLD